MPSLASSSSSIGRFFEKYGVLLAGAAIFAYYLWSTLDFFQEGGARRGLEGYLFQFDTLIVLWLLLWAGVKLMEYRRKQREENERNRRIVLEYERQKMRLDLLDEVTTTLTDAVNNPLSIITISSGSIRERFTSDTDVVAFLDRIDGALNRLREVLTDFQQYQTRKMMKAVEGRAVGGDGAVQERPSAGADGVLPADSPLAPAS
jgi:signal transduction histidine kinase